MYKKLRVSLVIPAYNEEKLIIPTLEAVPKLVDRIYVVDDCSTDAMPERVREFTKRDKRVTLIQHATNQGPGNAIITGYRLASADGYDITVVVGGDNQMPLDQIENFLAPIAEGKADYVKGNRFLLGGNAYTDMPAKRFFGNSMLSFMTKLASGYWNIFDTQDGYTAITKRAIDQINWAKFRAGYGYPSDFLVAANIYNLRVKDVPRRAIYLQGERQSQIKILKYIIKISPRLTRLFLKRIFTKYLFYDFSPALFFYLLSMIVIPLGLIFGVVTLFQGVIGRASINLVILCSLFIITGFQSFFFAVFFDMENNKKLQP